MGKHDTERADTPIGRPKSGYIPQLDGLRALAVLVVILSHAGIPFIRGGKSGVLVFFALSGFLITTILARELTRTGSVDFRKFYIRRVLRLAPALVTVVAFVTVVALLLPSAPESKASLEAIPSVLLYYNNWIQLAFGGDAMGWYPHFWSLAVEEQFYLVWPFIMFLAFKWKGLPAVAWTGLIGAVLSVLDKLFLWHGEAGRQAGTDFAADGLLLGCSLAALMVIGSPRLATVCKALFWPAVAALLAAAVLGNSSGSASTAQYELFGKLFWPLAVVSSVVIINTLVTGTAPRFVMAVLAWKPMVHIGRISYGMYLWHIIILAGLKSDWNPSRSVPVITLELLVLTVIVASLSFRYIEQPFLKRKNKFETVNPGAERAVVRA